MIVPHAVLVEKFKKFKESSHAEYGATWNRFLPKSLKNF